MEDKISRAARCAKLLEDPDLKRAFQDVRDALHQRFEKTSVSDGDTLLDIRKMLHLLDSVKANLVSAIEDGKLEEFHVEQQKKRHLGELLQWNRN